MTENLSTTTEENAVFAASLINTKNEKVDAKIVIISDSYHLFRCRLLFEKYFKHVQIFPSFSGFFERVYGSIREVPAILKNLKNGNLPWDEDRFIEMFVVVIND